MTHPKYIHITILLLLVAVQAFPQLRQNSAYKDYIRKYKDIAIEQMLKHDIPASITLAQGLLESGAGRSSLATQGNNHFGIKCHDWTGASMRRDDDARNECFRVYRNARESYEDHSLFLKKKRYANLFRLRRTDYKGWAKGLKACGYATNPQYASRLIDIIETYELDKYDKARTFDHFIAKHEGTVLDGFAAHTIDYRNKNYFVVARRGDTFASIGKEYDVSARKLARYNERNKKDVLQDGDIVYLKKKRSSAEKIYKRRPHVVKAGESMYDIAQKYGIRLKYLYKKNKLQPDYMPRVGDVLKVY
ncbi:MAG: glucosaminidase domain-containing protein [Prevotellaceae bacterium]|nr:glucosaminidase domain-containing protein [Prevotellaceae bacterium]MDY2750079.1 glucosaminidase domain-containing protein [Prevotella sp.]